MSALARRLALLERLRPRAQQRVVIISEGDPRPPNADFVIVLVAATTEKMGCDLRT